MAFLGFADRIQYDDAAHLATFQPPMRLASLAQRQYLVYLGFDLSGPQSLSEKTQCVPNQLRPVVEHRKVKPNKCLRFGHQATGRERLARSTSGTKQQIPPEGCEGVEVLLEHVAADRFDQDVDTAARGQLSHLIGPSGL